MDYDLKNRLKIMDAIAFASLDADAASAALNTMGFKGLSALITVGIGGITFTTSNKVEFKMTHSDDDSSYSAVTDDEVLLDLVASAAVTGAMGKSDLVVGTGGIVKSLIAAHAGLAHYLVGYRGKKQYVKITADFGGTHSSPTPMGVKWILSHPIFYPVNQGDYDDSHAINL